MKTPSKAPKLQAKLLEAREMELIGCDEDGRMSLWDVGMVRPVTRFKSDGRWIESGHYVIEWKGHAITVHCGNLTDGRISLLFMCSRGHELSLPLSIWTAILTSSLSVRTTGRWGTRCSTC